MSTPYKRKRKKKPVKKRGKKRAQKPNDVEILPTKKKTKTPSQSIQDELCSHNTQVHERAMQVIERFSSPLEEKTEEWIENLDERDRGLMTHHYLKAKLTFNMIVKNNQEITIFSQKKEQQWTSYPSLEFVRGCSWK